RHTLAKHLWRGRGKGKLKGCLVKAGERILIAPKGHAQRLKEWHERSRSKIIRAVECHVLGVVCNSTLPIGFVERAGVHVNPHDRAPGRDRMFTHDVLQTIIKFPAHQGWVGW